MGRAPCCDKASVKKGPWSPEEDRKLKEYIHNYGTGGNWISLPHKAGLKRCGKSCRLRWLNYLRPNIKHGSFSEEEDRIICSLFATIGSRWSIIAAQLPGRTDNDIKNYWNTKLKKKLMQAHGLQPLTARSSHHRCKKQQQQQHLFVSAEALSSSAPTSGDHLLSSLQHLSTPVHNFPHHNGSQCYDNNSSTSSLLMFGGNGDEQQLMMNSSSCPDSVGSGLGLYFEFCNNDGSSHGHDSAVAASLAMESLILQQDDHDKAPSLLAGDHQYGANTFCYEEAKPLVNVTAGDGGSNGDGDSMFYSSSSSPTTAGVSRQGSFMY